MNRLVVWIRRISNPPDLINKACDDQSSPLCTFLSFILMNGWAWSGILFETILQEQKCRLLENCMKEEAERWPVLQHKRMANLTVVLLNWVLIQMSLHGAWLTLYKCEWRVYIYNKSVIWEACSLICHYCCYTLTRAWSHSVCCESGNKEKGNSCALWVHAVTHFSCTVSPDEGKIRCTQCSCSRSRCVFHLYAAGKTTSLVHRCKFLAAHSRAAEGPSSTSCNNLIECQRYR